MISEEKLLEQYCLRITSTHSKFVQFLGGAKSAFTLGTKNVQLNLVYHICVAGPLDCPYTYNILVDYLSISRLPKIEMSHAI